MTMKLGFQPVTVRLLLGFLAASYGCNREPARLVAIMSPRDAGPDRASADDSHPFRKTAGKPARGPGMKLAIKLAGWKASAKFDAREADEWELDRLLINRQQIAADLELQRPSRSPSPRTPAENAANHLRLESQWAECLPAGPSPGKPGASMEVVAAFRCESWEASSPWIKEYRYLVPRKAPDLLVVMRVKAPRPSFRRAVHSVIDKIVYGLEVHPRE